MLPQTSEAVIASGRSATTASSSPRPMPKPPLISGPLLLLFAAITLVKLWIAWRFTGTIEVDQMRHQAEAFMAGADVLDRASTLGNPSFFPMGHYGLVSSCWLLANATGLPFAWLIKLPAIFADVLTATLLCTLSRSAGPLRDFRASEDRAGAVPRGNARVGCAYLLNPVTILLSAYHGQPHTVAVAFAVLALWAADLERPALAGTALALAASIRQHFAILALPLLASLKRRWPVMLATLLGLGLVVNLPLLSFGEPSRVLAPTWTYGSWGYTMLLVQGPRLLTLAGWTRLASVADALNRAIQAIAPAIYLAWAAAFILWTARRLLRHTLDPWRAALLFLVGLYALAPGFGIQWLLWAVPFWLVVEFQEGLFYSWLAGAFLAGSYWQWSLNAKYGVYSITANLHVLSRPDLLGVVAVGGLGCVLWALSLRTAWRLIRRA